MYLFYLFHIQFHLAFMPNPPVNHCRSSSFNRCLQYVYVVVKFSILIVKSHWLVGTNRMHFLLIRFIHDVLHVNINLHLYLNLFAVHGTTGNENGMVDNISAVDQSPSDVEPTSYRIHGIQTMSFIVSSQVDSSNKLIDRQARCQQDVNPSIVYPFLYNLFPLTGDHLCVNCDAAHYSL